MKHVLPAAALLASGSILLAPMARADQTVQPSRPVWGCVDPRASTALAIPDGRLRNQKWVEYVHRTGQCSLLPEGKPMDVVAHQGALLLLRSPDAADGALAVYAQASDMVPAPSAAAIPVPAPVEPTPPPATPAVTGQAPQPATPLATTTPASVSQPTTPSAAPPPAVTTTPASAPIATTPASPAPATTTPDAGSAAPVPDVSAAGAGAATGAVATPDAIVAGPAAPAANANTAAPAVSPDTAVPTANGTGIAPASSAAAPAPLEAPVATPEPVPVAPVPHGSSGMVWLALIVVLALLALVGAAVMVSRQQRRFANVEGASWPERDEHVDPMASSTGVVPKVQPEPTPQSFRKTCADRLEQGGWTIQPSFAAGASREGAPDILGRRRDAVLAVRCRGGSATVTPEIIDEVAAMGQAARAHVIVLATPAPLTRRAHDEAMRLHVHVLDGDELGSLSA